MNDRDADLRIPDPPRGIKAIPWRLPIWIYRLRLGWLLGHRFLLLTHKGRTSGKPRKAMLEVIKYEKETNTHYVASGFGEKSDWYQNITKNPEVIIQAGNKEFPATAEQLPSDDGVNVFLEYTHHHPNAIKNLAKLIGYDVGDTEEEVMEFLQLIPVIVVRPRE